MLVDRPACQLCVRSSGLWGTSPSRRTFLHSRQWLLSSEYLMTHRLTPVRVNFKS